MKYLNQYLIKEDIRLTNGKVAQYNLSLGKCKLKAQWYTTSIWMVNIDEEKKPTVINAGQNSFIASGCAK